MKKKLVSLVLLLCLLLTLCPAQAFAAEVGALEVVDWEALPAEDAEWEDAAEVVDWEALPAEDALEPVSFEAEAPAAVPTYELQAAKSGWQQSGGKWYYYENGRPVTGWKQISGKWYWFNGSGVMVTGWKQIGGKWYWFDGSGAMVTGWKQIGGKWYWFDGSGAMVTGWKQINGKWYWFDSSGAMVTGWKQINGKWYFFASGGAMATGWKQIGGKWYFFASGGAMTTGWKQIGGKWYWFDGSGAMVTGWKTLGGKTYYFNDDGSMATGKLTIDGEEYTFDENGALVESAYAVGDVITFGKYEQDNDTTNGTEDIEWIVIDKKADNLLLLSRYALDFQEYNQQNVAMTWENCSLRAWLNNDFLNAAFDSKEKEMIQQTLNTNPDNEYAYVDGGADTIDRVFLLNHLNVSYHSGNPDFIEYFGKQTQIYFHTNDNVQVGVNPKLTCRPTAYAIALGCELEIADFSSDDYTEEAKAFNGNCSWWLRSPGDNSHYAIHVNCFGGINDGSTINYKGLVRPAMWITPQ